jgi:hypothetical protein
MLDMISFEELLTARPRIHDGRTVTWAIHQDLARFLDETVAREHVTLETGSGLSTLVILRKMPRQHIAIQPMLDEFDVIRQFCQDNSIPTDRFQPIASRSQDYLPGAELPTLDLVLIDGDHSFPAPFVDWYFTADKLRTGGWMVVDDTDIVTGTILIDFMAADPKWEEVLRHPSGRFGIYRKKVHPIHEDDWPRQPYLKDVYPTKKIQVIRRPTPGRVERKLANLMPARLQSALQDALGWPRLE